MIWVVWPGQFEYATRVVILVIGKPSLGGSDVGVGVATVTLQTLNIPFLMHTNASYFRVTNTCLPLLTVLLFSYSSYPSHNISNPLNEVLKAHHDNPAKKRKHRDTDTAPLTKKGVPPP